ncbi:S-methyl-5'-thioadenosine phosphorylase [subsurface metagenome]
MKKEAKIGVIGGSGLYEIEGMTEVKKVKVKTPFGDPSDAIVIGSLEGTRIAFLPRHGKGHHISPTELPVRANIYALKSLGVEWIISISAVGSLKEEIRPLDLVIPDQLIDRTKSRVNTFFDRGLVAHVAFADPFCPVLSDILYQAAQDQGARVHKGGTCVVMEGPLFSTKAESNLYRSLGASIIGMTALPEAKLAREAEICYATVACVTDLRLLARNRGVSISGDAHQQSVSQRRYCKKHRPHRSGSHSTATAVHLRSSFKGRHHHCPKEDTSTEEAGTWASH